MIEKIRLSPVFALVSRILLTFIFWSSGLAKLFDFQAAVAEMEHFGVLPAAPMAMAVIFVQLTGSALIISGRHVWLGAGALAVFTIMTIPIAHAFWQMTGEKAFMEMMFAFEHITVVGGLMVVATVATAVKSVPSHQPSLG